MASNKTASPSSPTGKKVKETKSTSCIEPAHGWAVVANFGPSGVRWSGTGPRLKVVAVNLERGTGSTTAARLDLLRKAIDLVHPDGPIIYLTPAGFFGCASSRGDHINDGNLSWPGIADPAELTQLLGEQAAALPKDTMLAIGVDKGSEDALQEQWWFRGGRSEPERQLVRGAMLKGEMKERTFQVDGFHVLGFVCGELWDGGSGFEFQKHTAGLDLVLDLAHASINRLWDRTVRPERRCAFQRTFFDLKLKCGAMLAYAHDMDTKAGIVRRQNNWILFKKENPFPEDGYEALRL